MARAAAWRKWLPWPVDGGERTGGKSRPGTGRARRPGKRTPAKRLAGTSAKPSAKKTTKTTKKTSKKPARTSKASSGGWRQRFTKGTAVRRTPVERDKRQPPLTGVARGALMLVAFVCMVGFAVVLAKLTLVPSPASVSLVHPNFRPGASIRAYIDQPGVRDTVKQIGGNVVLGVPFGFLLPVVFPRTRGLVRVVVVTAFVMLCVETAQGTLIEGRAFDIDDVILNTFGALLGYLFVGRRLGRTVHPRRRHWWQRDSGTASGRTP